MIENVMSVSKKEARIKMMNIINALHACVASDRVPVTFAVDSDVIEEKRILLLCPWTFRY